MDELDQQWEKFYEALRDQRKALDEAHVAVANALEMIDQLRAQHKADLEKFRVVSVNG